MKTAYFDCIGGISGDMTLAALVDAGADVEALRAGLRTLSLPEWQLEVGRTRKSGIAAATVEVLVHGEAAGAAPMMRVPPDDSPLSNTPAPHSHSHHEHAPAPAPTHTHSRHEHSHYETSDHSQHEHGHTEPSSHTHHEHGHSHEAPAPTPTLTPNPAPTPPHSHTPPLPHSHDHSSTRTFAEVEAVIRRSGLPDQVKEDAVRVYRRLAEAEAHVHGASIERVHFHEVGAVDSIVDVVGAVYALYLLGVERVLCSPLPNGHGFVRCAHGLMPIPPPATAELLKGCPMRAVDIQAELVTPTGAALASALAESFGPLPGFTIEAVGYGAGRKDFPFPNLLRVLIGEDATAPSEADDVTLIEANIDDQSPQLYETVMASLFEAGALDAWLTPIQMKKGRPGVTLSVLCETPSLARVQEVIFAETTTLGVRFSSWQRRCLQREWIEVGTRYGTIRVKVGRQNGELRTATPEYEDCRSRALEAGVPVKLVQLAATAAAWERLGPDLPPHR